MKRAADSSPELTFLRVKNKNPAGTVGLEESNGGVPRLQAYDC